MQVSSEQLADLTHLYNQGYYLRAYRIAQSIGPLPDWQGTAAILMAARMAGNLGSESLARNLFLKAYRLDPENGEARYYKARTIADYRGPLAAWTFLRRTGETIDAAPTLRADWLGLHAVVLGSLRDFDAAGEWIKKAEALDPTNPWIWIERSHLLQLEDKYEEALEAANRSLQLRPYFRPGMQAFAHLLVLLGRDSEALDLLKSADGKIESCWVAAQLARLQTELGLHTEARQSVERFAELAPLLDPVTEQWLQTMRADTAYLCGDYDAALRHTQLSENPLQKLLGERMRAAPEGAARTLLPVGFVRQHHMTCAPATLTLVSRFWQMPADHLAVVEEICYGGTPARSERHWAETHGWVAREFRVTWEDTVKLIDRGVPFTFATVNPGNAHLQAVIGYDSRRATLLVRDPYDRNLIEYSASETLEHYRSSGPRGMAMVPLAQKHLIEDLELSEADFYDGLYGVQQALYTHDRSRADQISQEMMRAGATHRLTFQAQLAIAEYDSDEPRVLACLDKLLELFPEDANTQAYKLGVLRRMARRQERIELLESVCKGKQTHVLFWQAYAAELASDGRASRKALKLLRRALRSAPTDAQSYYLLAGLLWSQQRFSEAKELYRFAACLGDTNEEYVGAYFSASRYFHEHPETVRFLENRFRRFGRRSNSPARTLAWAYEEVDQQPKAIALLKDALALRPDDGELMLHAADVFARMGQFEEAEHMLQKAEGKTRRGAWLHCAALIAGYRGDAATALARWQEIAAAEPLNLNAARNIARLLAEQDGEAPAIVFLREQVARLPHNLALHRLLAERLRDDPAELEPALRAMIEVDPADAWTRRELAQLLTGRREYQAAGAEAALARDLEPTHPDGYNVIAKIHEAQGNIEEAKSAYRRAIALSVDNDYAIANLIAISHSVAERRAALQFVKEELVRQVTFGDGLLAYREYARGTLDHTEVHDLLREAFDARPDLWHAWSALIQQSIDLQRYDEALALARTATERFPLVPRAWLDLSMAYQAKLDRRGEVEALERAIEINRSWGKPVRQLADVCLHLGEMQKARALLEKAIAQSPLDFENHGYLAAVLWRMGEQEAAIEGVKRALTIEPGYNWAWDSLRAWSAELGRDNEARNFLRETAARRSGQARSWLLLAQGLDRPEDLDERLNALDRALEINPRIVEAHALRARLLAGAQRLNDARAACRPEIFAGNLPLGLRIAAAVIEAETGNKDEFIAQIKTIVAEEPNSYEAWNAMAEWTRIDPARQMEYLEAATELARIAPNYTTALGCLGEARRAAGDRAGAKEAFARSLALAADYSFGGFHLFDLQVEDDEIDAAAATLEILKRHVGGDWVTAREVQLAIRRNDAETAIKVFQHLCH